MSMPQAPHLLAKAQILRTSLREGPKTEEPLGESERNIRRTYVAPWLPLALLGSPWLLLCSWHLLASPGSSWLPLAPTGISGPHLASPGYLWLLLAPHVKLLPIGSKVLARLQRTAKGLQGSKGASTGSQELPRLQGAPGFPKYSQELPQVLELPRAIRSSNRLSGAPGLLGNFT